MSAPKKLLFVSLVLVPVSVLHVGAAFADVLPAEFLGRWGLLSDSGPANKCVEREGVTLEGSLLS